MGPSHFSILPLCRMLGPCPSKPGRVFLQLQRQFLPRFPINDDKSHSVSTNNIFMSLSAARDGWTCPPHFSISRRRLSGLQSPFRTASLRSSLHASGNVNSREAQAIDYDSKPHKQGYEFSAPSGIIIVPFVLRSAILRSISIIFWQVQERVASDFATSISGYKLWFSLSYLYRYSDLIIGSKVKAAATAGPSIQCPLMRS